jgi:hypothetical protein
MGFEEALKSKTDPAALREKRATAIMAARAIHDRAEAEDRDFTKGESAEYDDLLSQARRLTNRIDMVEAGGNVSVGTGPSIYRTAPDAGDPGRHFVKDLIAASKGDSEAREMLEQHTRAVADIERRSGLTAFTATAGAEFAGPILSDMGAAALIPRTYGRPYLDALGTEPLPLGQGAEFLVPEYTGTSTVAKTAEGGNVAFTDWVSATKTIDVQTIAGGVTISQQYLDLAPAFANEAIAVDLSNKYAAACEAYAITSTDTNAKGLAGTASPNTVVTTGSDLSLIWRAILAAKQQVADTASYVDADLVAMNSLMLSNIIAAAKAPAAGTAVDGRPESVRWPEGNLANARFNWNGSMIGMVGTIGGTPVVVSQAVPINAGAGTNESRIYVLRRGLGHRVFESPMRVKVASGVGIATLQPKIVAFGYLAQYAPKPKALSVVSGTATVVTALTA